MAKKIEHKVVKGEFEEQSFDLDQQVETLKNAAASLATDIEEAEERVAEMNELFLLIREKRQKLRAINRIIFTLTGEGKTRARRPNGANRSMISQFLNEKPLSSVRVISESTGISIPSVRAALRSGGFKQDESHLWSTCA